MSFGARDIDLSELWGSVERRYSIPRYQREYSWKTDNLVKFWADLHDDEEFFFGSIVLRKPEQSGVRQDIIDGQQRILTMTILYAAIRDTMADLGSETHASHLHNSRIFQMPTTILGTGHYIVKTPKRLRDYFQRSVQSFPSDFRNPTTNEQKSVKKNYQWFKNEINKRLELAETENDKWEVINDIQLRLNRIRIIRIFVADSYDAYRIFETVNATGVDLSVADLLKNMIFRHCPEEGSGEDEAQRTWDSMKDILGEVGVDVARFVRYHWISTTDFVTKGNLYKSVKAHTTRSGWSDLLLNLHADAKLLNSLMLGTIPNPNSQPVIEKVNAKLKAIGELGVSQCYVLLLSVLRNRELLGFGWEDFLKLVIRIENFNFIYHKICARPSNKVESFYSNTACRIHQLAFEDGGSDRESRFRGQIRSVYTEFEDIKPNRQDFINDFSNKTSYANSTKKKNFIRYILRRVEDNKYPIQSIERPIENSISIEHILPQNSEEFWGIPQEEVLPYVHLLGNLVLVAQPLNSASRNFELTRKIPKLRETAITTTSDLLSDIESRNPIDWTEDDIKNRTEEIAQIAYDDIWSAR